jgi:single-stranded-DNA-specific exonuclease
MNRERRHIEADMQNDAWEDLQSIDATRNSICLMNESWHQGVIGIVASRIKERFYRPTIIFAPGEDQGQPILKGSGRSIVGFHLRDALDMVAKRHPRLILKFGGHAMAAGLSIPTHAWEDFQTAFEKVAQELLNEDLLARQLHHDGCLQDDEISPALADLLRQQVWGQGFAQPVFIGDFEVISQSLVQDKHLRVQVRSLTEPHAKVWGGIWFGRTQSLERESRLAYRLAYDEFGGTPRAQLHIEACEEVV